MLRRADVRLLGVVKLNISLYFVAVVARELVGMLFFVK